MELPPIPEHRQVVKQSTDQLPSYDSVAQASQSNLLSQGRETAASVAFELIKTRKQRFDVSFSQVEQIIEGLNNGTVDPNDSRARSLAVNLLNELNDQLENIHNVFETHNVSFNLVNGEEWLLQNINDNLIIPQQNMLGLKERLAEAVMNARKRDSAK